MWLVESSAPHQRARGHHGPGLSLLREDLRHAVSKTLGIKDQEELKRKRAEFVESVLRPWAANMEKQVSGPFAGGGEISVADIKLFVVLGAFKDGVYDHVPTDVLAAFPKLDKLHANVKAHPKVAAWYARAQG